VRCTQGEVFDVVVDMREYSQTFGHWEGVVLSAENKRQLWIPEGFAHGFVTLSDDAEFLYKTTNYWVKDCERSLLWSDSYLNINWPRDLSFIISEKDRLANEWGNAAVLKNK
jgi:dTDP-4-dehydrorhamnose 3,5-epimerase